MENRLFAKLNNKNEFEYAEDVIRTSTATVTNPRRAHYLNFGYIPVVFTDCPEEVKEGYHYVDKLINDNGVPTVIWELVKDEEGNV